MTVLQRKELESSPLADLHAIASELGLEGFRSKRKGDLIGAILDAQGGEGASEPEPAEPVEDEAEPDEVPSEESLEGPSGQVEPAEGDLGVVEEEPEIEDEASDEEILSGALDILGRHGDG